VAPARPPTGPPSSTTSTAAPSAARWWWRSAPTSPGRPPRRCASGATWSSAPSAPARWAWCSGPATPSSTARSRLLLRRSLDSDDDERLEQRLLGEARALAKLAHPNVVAVFEVARHDGELYLVMELIEGPTLGAWLLAAARTTDEVLAMFAQAGRGLAAAHAAGIVHRDVKPDNVLVGADGRARITDFGLATGALAGPLPEVHGDDIALTMTGALAGTPAYMAPEVLRGGDATPQSDQFGFAVALWCGLCGARPFHGDSVDALLRAIEIDDPRLPPGRRIDARVRAVVARGLATDPAARWPSVAAMLDALERARPGRRTRTIAIAGAVAVIAAGAAAAAVTRDHRGPTCATDGAVWTPAAAAKVQAALRAAAPELAATATTAVADAVARWQARWDHERLATCRQGGEVEAARGGCLDLQRRQVESTVALLGEATGAVAEDAIVTADRLPDPRACVRAAGTPVTDRSAAARALAARLADARALHHVGRFRRRRHRVRAIVAAATAGGHAGVRLDALLLLAESQSDDGERKAAMTTFDQATTLAIARGDDHALAEALVHLVSVHANGGELAAHELALGLATAALARAGGDPELDALLAQGRCRAGWRRPAELERGVRECEEAARRWRALRGGDSYEATGVVNQLGLLAYTGGHYEEALAQFQRYEQLNLRWHSPTHHNTDTARVNAADTLVKLGRRRGRADRARRAHPPRLGLGVRRAGPGAAPAPRRRWGDRRVPPPGHRRRDPRLRRRQLPRVGRGRRARARAPRSRRRRRRAGRGHAGVHAARDHRRRAAAGRAADRAGDQRNGSVNHGSTVSGSSVSVPMNATSARASASVSVALRGAPPGRRRRGSRLGCAATPWR
jgi:tetratricopeptide (TPR) repeat protein